MKIRDKKLEEAAAKILRGELTESIELEEAAEEFADDFQVELEAGNLHEEFSSDDVKVLKKIGFKEAPVGKSTYDSSKGVKVLYGLPLRGGKWLPDAWVGQYDNGRYFVSGLEGEGGTMDFNNSAGIIYYLGQAHLKKGALGESVQLGEARIQPGDTVTAKEVVDWARGNGKTITPKGKLFSVEKIDGVFAHLSDQKGGKFEANIKDLTLQESIELEEVAGTDAPSPKDIIDLVKKLPTTDIKAFLDDLATVFDKKADEEDSDDLSDIYRSVSKHIHSAFSVWFQGALDKL